MWLKYLSVLLPVLFSVFLRVQAREAFQWAPNEYHRVAHPSHIIPRPLPQPSLTRQWDVKALETTTPVITTSEVTDSTKPYDPTIVYVDIVNITSRPILPVEQTTTPQPTTEPPPITPSTIYYIDNSNYHSRPILPPRPVLRPQPAKEPIQNQFPHPTVNYVPSHPPNLRPILPPRPASNPVTAHTLIEIPTQPEISEPPKPVVHLVEPAKTVILPPKPTPTTRPSLWRPPLIRPGFPPRPIPNPVTAHSLIETPKQPEISETPKPVVYVVEPAETVTLPPQPIPTTQPSPWRQPLVRPNLPARPISASIAPAVNPTIIIISAPETESPPTTPKPPPPPRPIVITLPDRPEPEPTVVIPPEPKPTTPALIRPSRLRPGLPSRPIPNPYYIRPISTPPPPTEPAIPVTVKPVTLPHPEPTAKVITTYKPPTTINYRPVTKVPVVPVTSSPVILVPSTSSPFNNGVRRPPSRTPIEDYSNVLVDYHCPQPDAFYPIANECDTYIDCKNNVARSFMCPDGLHFNPNAIWPNYPCAYPSEVQCNGREIKQTAQPTAECPRQYGYFALNDGDCSRYIMCQEGLATIMNCPPGLAYNPDKYICDWPETIPSCNPQAFRDFTCPAPLMDDDGQVSDLITMYRYGNSCKEYIACQRGYPRLLSCDPGLSFDEQSQTCVDSNYVTNCQAF